MFRIRQSFCLLVSILAIVVLVSGCTRQESVNLEKLKSNVRLEIEEAWNNGNLDMLDDLYVTDFVYHIPPYPDVEGLDGYKKYISDIRSSYPDVKLTIDEIIVEGDIGSFRWTFNGTQTGESPTLGIPATNKNVTFTGCAVFYTVNGKTVETWNYVDWVILLKQLGFEIIPPE